MTETLRIDSSTDDARADARLAWARDALGDADATLERASTDAGFRSYWRSRGTGPARIVMDAPPGLEDVAPWLAIRALLEHGGVRVPRVLATDATRGLLLLEDLGTQTYLQLLDEHNADALMDAAIDQLLRVQAIAPPADLPRYDEPLLVRELSLFDAWFLERHLGLRLDCDDGDRLELGYRRLVNAALAQPVVLVHRDYMPRNLMPADDGPAVLDFQDAVAGPIAYDVLSLFKDAFLSWPEARVQDWVARYHQRATAARLPVPALARFRRDLDLIGVQRHLKVLGIFARLRHRDGKPHYLDDAARFLGYLDAVVPAYPELDPLAELLAHRVRPALAAQAGA
jgi:aminoglycoside/choline kinase family phosphotransferase